MYTIIPMPQIEWNKNSMKYVFLFFHLLGILIGALEIFWFILSKNFGLNNILYSSVAVVIPIIFTGGIHLDGLVDTFDAIFCFGDKEKKLTVLKDPLVGAFGVIYLLVYLLLCFGLYSQIFEQNIKPFFLLFAYSISRIASSFITINFPSAKNSGLKYIFANGSNKKIINICLVLFSGIYLVLFFKFYSFNAVVISLSVILFSAWLYFYSKKNFGGVNGDIAGFSICIIELIFLACSLIKLK